MADQIVIRGAREHNLKNIDVDDPARPARGHHRALGLGQVVARLRHHLRRGAAALRRVAVGLRAPVPRADGEARRRLDRRALAGDLDRAEDDVAQPALDGRHRHRDLRLPAPAVRARRHAALPPAAASRSRSQTVQQIVDRVLAPGPRERASRCWRRSCATARASTGRSCSSCARRASCACASTASCATSPRTSSSRRRSSTRSRCVVDRLVVQAGHREAARRLGRDRVPLRRRPGQGRGAARERRRDDREPVEERAPLLAEVRLRRLRHLVSRAHAAHVLVQQPARRVPDLRRPRRRAVLRSRADRARRRAVARRGRDRPVGEDGRARIAPLLAGLAAALQASTSTRRGASCRRRSRRAVLHGTGKTRSRSRFGRGRQGSRGRSRACSRSSSGATARPSPSCVREELEAYQSERPCAACGGARLKPRGAVRPGRAARSITEVTAMSIDRGARLLRRARADAAADGDRAADPEGDRERLGFLVNVGLDYLTLDRSRGHPLRRRGAAHPAGDADRLVAGRRALHPRRAVDRPAPARQRAPARDARSGCAISATR